MTVAEVESAVDQLIERYLDDPSNGTPDDIAWLLENIAKQIREGAYEKNK